MPTTDLALLESGFGDVNDLVERVVNADTLKPARWEKVMTVPMRFNRLVLFSPWAVPQCRTRFRPQGPAMPAATRDFAQDHVRILSGLYGVLRPLDRIQPYRLEMGIKLPVGRKPTLYAFWADRVARALADDLAGHADPTLVNLASVEYFAAVAVAKLPGPVLSIDFRDAGAAGLRFNTFAAKRARGAMARLMCEGRIDRAAGLKDLDVDGYRFDAGGSDDARWLFVRTRD